MAKKSAWQLYVKKNLYGATNIIKNTDKDNWIYSGYWIAFNGKGLWNFDNDFVRNVVIFGLDNNSLSDSDNRKSYLFILVEDPTSDIKSSFGSPEKYLVLILVKQT